jgi:hypothetical protein
MKIKISLISTATIGAICFFGCIGFAIYMTWREETSNRHLTNEALAGNKYAISFLAKYKKPWRDDKIIYEAIKGNKYALEILGINEKQNKEEK